MTLDQRKLIKQLGLKSTMRIRDFYSACMDDDRPDFLKDMRNYVETEYGDSIFIISLEPPKLKRKVKSLFPITKKE